MRNFIKSNFGRSSIIKSKRLLVTGDRNVANELNLYFSKVADTLVSKFCYPTNAHNFEVYNSKKFEFSNFCIPKVESTINSLNPNKAMGLDNIPAKLARCASNILKAPLTEIFNPSLRESLFPSFMKNTKIFGNA